MLYDSPAYVIKNPERKSFPIANDEKSYKYGKSLSGYVMTDIFHFNSFKTRIQDNIGYLLKYSAFNITNNCYSKHWYLLPGCNRCHVFLRKINNNISQHTAKNFAFEKTVHLDTPYQHVLIGFSERCNKKSFAFLFRTYYYDICTPSDQRSRARKMFNSLRMLNIELYS